MNDNEALFQIRQELERIRAAVERPIKVAFNRLEARQALGISDPMLGEWIDQGRLHGTRTSDKEGAHWMFTWDDLQAAVKYQPPKETAP